MFYALLLVHKKPQHFLGDPIVSGSNSLMQGMSTYANKILTPFVTSLLSHVKDTKNTVTKLHEIMVTVKTFLKSLTSNLFTVIFDTHWDLRLYNCIYILR